MQSDGSEQVQRGREKHTARTNLKNAASLLANKVYSDADVTDAQKVSLGMPPRNAPMPIPAPSSAPGIEILSTNGWTVKVRLTNTQSGAGRGKPAGIFGAAVFTYVGANPPGDLSEYQFEGNTGKVVVDVTLPSTVPAGANKYGSRRSGSITGKRQARCVFRSV